jgi:hypothetical protein
VKFGRDQDCIVEYQEASPIVSQDLVQPGVCDAPVGRCLHSRGQRLGWVDKVEEE